MPRSRLFLAIVLILMLVNAAFFAAWYAFGLRGKFRNFVAAQAGKAMKGELSIKELHFSDRQIFAEGISFNSADSSMAFSVQRLRVQYNLTRFIFSGFKSKRLVREIDVFRPVFSYNYQYKPKPPKASKPFKLTDLAGYFKSVRVREGKASIKLSLPLKIIQEGDLRISEELSSIEITVLNDTTTRVKLQAVSAKKGRLKVTGTLDKGRIAIANAELEAFRPLYASHPDVQNLRTEISLVASLAQDSLKAPFTYEAKAQLWSTQALFADAYQVKIPFLGVETDGHNLNAQLSRSTFGSSSISADASISKLDSKPQFDKLNAVADVDLAMLYPELTGFVNVIVTGSGTIKDPVASLKASSGGLSYKQHSLQNFSINADYADKVVQFTVPESRLDNQIVSIEGSFIPDGLILDAQISTKPYSNEAQAYLAQGNIEVHAELLAKYPLVQAELKQISFSSGDLQISGIDGHLNLVPLSDTEYYLDAKLTGDNGFMVNVIGDILNRDLLLDLTVTELKPHLIYSNPILDKLQAKFSGSVKATMQGNKIYSHFVLDTNLNDFLPYQGKLDGVGSIDLQNLHTSLQINGTEGIFNAQPLDFSLAASLTDKQLLVNGLSINDRLSLSGRLNLADLQDLDFALAATQLSSRELVAYYPAWDVLIPDFEGLSVFAEYNRDGSQYMDARLDLASIDLLAVPLLGMKLTLQGPVSEIAIAGEISSSVQKLLELNGVARLKPQMDLSLQAEFSDIDIARLILNSPASGFVSGNAGMLWTDIKGEKINLLLNTDLTAKQIVIGEYKISDVRVKASQEPTKLVVDSLHVLSDQLFEINGSGALDYNAISREFFPGDNQLHLDIQGQLFSWVKRLSDYIEESRGNSALTLSIGTFEDQFHIPSGNLEISDGYMELKDQPEPFENINIRGVFDKNRLIIERGQVEVGDGKLVFSNVFEADPSDHLVLSFLDLGILRLIVEEPGIPVNIPLFTSPRSSANIILKGQGSRYATVKGPFDMMKISGEATLSNASALYPPNTNNLLKLANTVREATARRSEVEAIPLPFTLDVMIKLGENVRYVTYPANLFMQQGAFLHLLYDGLIFSVEEAFFSSERGSVDIFGTVFQVEKVDVTMVDSQDLLNVGGTFYKRAPDGTMVTLRVTTSSDRSKSFADRLEFSLTSDNPEDRTISQILARLRYSGSTDPNAETKNGELQDEALNLISGNLDSTLLTPIFSPVENFIRRKLKLDNFSINAGFIQNLYTQYSNDPNLISEYSDMRQLSTSITQFSSSILLNNLSISMSKYLGRRLFLDYDLELQEATDLQKKTRLMVSHSTSLRFMLPKQFRLGYTFEYTPLDNKFSHEIMLQRSFRFWGL